VGWAVGPYLSGIIQQRYGFSPLFVITTVLYAIAILLTWVFFRNKQRLSPQPSLA
jgi:predicted MFS family arabinose efflux permease